MIVSFSDPCVVMKMGISKQMQFYFTSTGHGIENFPSTLAAHSELIWQVIFLSDNERMASCSADKTIKLWDTSSGTELSTLNGSAFEVFSIALLPNGWLASGSSEATIKVWDLEESKEVKTLTGHTDAVVSLAVLKNGNLVSYSHDDTIKIWNPYLAENNLLLTISGHGNTSSIIPIGVLSNDFLVTCSGDEDDELKGILQVWDSNDGKLVKTLSHWLSSLWTVVVLSNDQVGIGSGDGTIKIIDLEDDSKTRIKVEAHDGEVTCLLQLPNGNLVSAGIDEEASSSNYSIKVWNISNFTLLQSINTGHSVHIYSMSINKDGTLLATASKDQTIKLWPMTSVEAAETMQIDQS